MTCRGDKGGPEALPQVLGALGLQCSHPGHHLQHHVFCGCAAQDECSPGGPSPNTVASFAGMHVQAALIHLSISLCVLGLMHAGSQAVS